MGQLFISGMINGVAQPVLTKVSDDLERQKRVFRKMLRFTAFVSFPAMLGLGIVSEELIIITITDKWYFQHINHANTVYQRSLCSHRIPLSATDYQ